MVYKNSASKLKNSGRIKIYLIRSVFDRNRTGTRSEKNDRIDRNQISGRTLYSIPSPWSESKGMFLPKPGKMDYNQLKAFS